MISIEKYYNFCVIFTIMKTNKYPDRVSRRIDSGNFYTSGNRHDTHGICRIMSKLKNLLHDYLSLPTTAKELDNIRDKRHRNITQLLQIDAKYKGDTLPENISEKRTKILDEIFHPKK